MKVGGSFLINKIGEEEIFTCELFSDEQKEIAKLTEDFAIEQILPKKRAIEELDQNISRSLMKQAGELGLLAVDIPEEFEGLGMDKVTSSIINEKIAMGQTSSFTVTFSAHSGIGTLPIVIFGNDEQKRKYLPRLGSGDWISAYALTEPGSGSDALAAKSIAKLDSDGQYYILNGTKQFITNGGWCDLAIVYAKVDGDKFTAFLVEMDSPGIERGAEENKMGLKGSSTTSLSFNDVKVPVANVLGKIGKGHHIAFNILNIGRYKLGAAVLGSSKVCINEAVKYAKDRKQFNQPISNFDAIKSKFANMVVRTYELESILYRTVGEIDEAIHSINKNDQNYYDQIVHSLETFATEASICKVFGSEAIWMNADEGLQVFGGYGYTEEYPLASIMRDSRVDRIYEGTNEINRQIIAGHFIKKAITGELPVTQKLKAIERHLSGHIPKIQSEILKEEKIALELSKFITLYLFNVSMQKFGESLKNEHQLLEILANLCTDIYVMDTTLSRITQAGIRSDNFEILKIIGQISTMEKVRKIVRDTKIALLSTLENNELNKALADLTVLSKGTELKINLFKLKRNLSEYLYEQGKYPF